MATSRRSRTARPCAAAHLGCTCNGDEARHNIQAFNRRQEKIAAMPHDACPRCGQPGLPAVIAAFGFCFNCKRADDAIKYGFRKDAAMTESPAIGTQVRFRPDFGEVGEAGLVFTVDTEPSVDNARADGQRLQMVGLKIRNANGRWGYRLAYVRDLISASKPAEG